MSLGSRLRAGALALLGATARPHDEPVASMRGDNSSRTDGTFANSFTGFGVEGVDVSLGARPRSRRPLTESERDEGYRRGGYFRRIVNIVPNEATRCGWSVNLDPETEPDPARARDVCRDEDRRLRTRRAFRTADAMARLHGGALILMVTDEKTSGAPIGLMTRPDLGRYASPLDVSKVVRVRALHVFTKGEASVYKWDDDPNSPTYREPLLWHITPRTGGIGEFASGVIVHSSRVLYFPGNPLPPHLRIEEDGWDDPVIEVYRDAIADKEAIDRAGALAASRLEVAILKVKGLASKEGKDLDGFFARKMRALAQSWSMLGVMLIGEGDEFSRQGFTATGFDSISANAATALAAVEGIPITILLGEAPGGLTTDNQSGRQTFDRFIAAHQIERYEPNAIKLYDVILATKGYTDPSYSIDFAPLHEPTAKELAEVDEIIARTDAAYVQMGALSADEIRSSRFGRPDSPIALDAETDLDDEAPLYDLDGPEEEPSEGTAGA